MVSVFAVCFALWLLLSGHYAPVYVALGALAAALVAVRNRGEEAISGLVRRLPAFLAYLPWLLGQIVVSNIEVARLVLHPRLPIDPVIVRLRTRLADDLAVTTLANSITLTPGTVTLDVDGDELVVHAFTSRGAASLLQGAMERHVARIFGEPRP